MKSQVGSQKSEVSTHQSAACSAGVSPATWFSLVAVVLLAVVSARAATLEGTVLDPSGRAVPGARVTLLSSFVVLAEKSTDENGKYEFAGLRGGGYRLVANRPGFTASPVQIEVGEEETRAVELRLELSAVEQRVVVSASLGGTLAPQIGSSVNVISEQEIEERDARGVYEVLRGLPGVEVNQSGRHGGVTGVFIRGGNSNYNLVMVDGMQVNQFGGDFDFASLPASAAERVELTRGPQSALYGSNAFTGVINVVSRQGRGRPHFTALIEGGSFTTRRFATGGSGLTRGLSWAYDLSRLDSGGVVENDRYRTQSGFLSLGYPRSPRRQANFHFFGNANNAGAPGPYGSDPLGFFGGIDTISRDQQNLFGYQGSYAEQFSSRFRQVFSGGVATNKLFFHSPFGDSFSNNLRGLFNTRSEITLSNQDFLVAGFEYNREQIKNTFITDAAFEPFLLPRTTLAFFAENRWSPSARLFVIAGVRVDNLRTRSLPSDAFGSRPLIPENSVVKVNPRISVAYLARESSGGDWLGGTRLHGSFGTGIRAPSGFELAFTDNPALKPERSISFDAGIEQRFFHDRAVVDATYFHNRIQNQIVVLGGSLTNLSSFVSDNLGNARAQGMEFSFRMRPVSSLAVSGQYTFLDSELLAVEGSNIALSPFRVGQQLLRRPRNSGAYNITWRRGRLMLNTNGYIRGRVLDVEPNLGTFTCVLGLPCLFDNKGYTRADAGLAFQLSPAVEVYGRLNNFLNQKYEESFGFPALRLNFAAGIRINFPRE